MIKRIFICITLLAIMPSLKAREMANQQDTSIRVAIDAYWKRLLSIDAKVYAIGCGYGSVLQFQDAELKGFGQQIIKTDSNIYVHLAATGILYKGTKENDSLLKFTRIDDTHNKYYNQGGYLLAQKENIFILGGYGFWKSNGHLKKFNFRDREWDIAPLTKEIHPPLVPKPGVWHDVKGNYIYLLHESKINDAIVDNPNKLVGKNTTYLLNLKTMIWEEKLPLHPKALGLIKNGIYQLQNEKGIYIFKGIDLYKVDIKANQILKMSDRSYSQSFARVLLQDMIYAVQHKIYYKELKTGKLDSLVLPMEKFIPEPYPIFKQSVPEYAIWLFFLLLLISVSVMAFFSINSDQARLSDIRGAFSFNDKFSTTEIALISLLISKSRNKQKANISELNYVLGVKDKNTGFQKKVRSEAINSINEKFRYMMGGEGGLISSERSEMDKRYFEYFIPRNLIRVAEDITKANP